MTTVRSCTGCTFCQPKVGLVRMRHVCLCPAAERYGTDVGPSTEACGRFSAQPKLRGLGRAAELADGVRESLASAAARESAGASPRAASRDRDGLAIGCDVHTHTVGSRHAYATIEENVRAAARAGVELLGSTDHFSSMLYPEVRGIERAREYDIRDYQYFLNFHTWPRQWEGVRVLHGCEADIVDLEGHLFGHDIGVTHEIGGNRATWSSTLKERVFKECDYVIASVHGDAFLEGATRAQGTAMYLRALEDPKVLILGHVGRSGVDFDVDEVVAAARDLGKMIEINAATLRSRKRASERCRTVAERCAELGAMVSTGTDAHISPQIGQFGPIRTLLEEIRFPQELVGTASAAAFLGAMEHAGLAVPGLPADEARG